MTESSNLEQRSFRIDSLRQGADGIVQPLIESVFLIVAINGFHTGDFWKGLIAASNFIGFLLSSPLTGMLNRTGIPRSKVLFILTATAAAMLTAAIFSPSGPLFAIAVTCSSAAVHLRQPFFSDLYSEVYSPEDRARRVSIGIRLSLVISLLMGLAYGKLLDGSLDRWRLLFAFGAVVTAASAVMLLRLPQRSVKARDERWWQAMAMPFRNPVFLYVQVAWMLIGLGNLWTLPLRAVYLAEAERGLGLSPSMVTLAIVVIPAAARFLFNPLWARLYHKMSFPALRMAINIFFMISIPLYFLTDSIWVIFLAAFLFGVGTSGSPFIWQLWVTRIVPPSETRIYQSAHAFLAGVRGVSAPFIGFAALQSLDFRTMGFISCALAAASTMMMIPLMRPERKF